MDNKQNNKLRGGYYTPTVLADFLVEWAFRDNRLSTILEPSLGDGIFIESIARHLSKISESSKKRVSIFGVELFPEELSKAKNRVKKFGLNPDRFHLFSGDFFSIFKKNLRQIQFDAVVGNPPFIRYQNFPVNQRKIAEMLANDFGIKTNRLTNVWLFFLLVSIFSLNDSGRLAMVIPAELLQVNYAKKIRHLLTEHFSSITLVTFKKLIFKNALQEVVLLLAEKKGGKFQGIDIIEIKDLSDLERIGSRLNNPKFLKKVDNRNDKWTQYFLDQEEIDSLKESISLRSFVKVGDLMDIDVGIVTGQNDFFLLSEEEVEKYKLQRYIRSVVARTSHLGDGIIFSRGDWNKNKTKNFKVHLFSYTGDQNPKKNSTVERYIKIGEKINYHKGYKCSIRKKWYQVPSIWVPNAFLLRQIYRVPRLVYNAANAVSTDTIHRVHIHDEKNAKNIVCGFLNSCTLANIEISGRSYGGGVLEIEPSEAENLPIPSLSTIKLDYKQVDILLREGKIDEVLDYVDGAVMKVTGLSMEKMRNFRRIWHKLSKRRLERN